MSEIYIKKKVFWKYNSSESTSHLLKTNIRVVILITIMSFIILLVSLIMNQRKQVFSITEDFNDKYSTFKRLEDKISSKIKNFLKALAFLKANETNAVKTIPKNMTTIPRSKQKIKLNTFNQCMLYEGDYAAQEFSKKIISYLFYYCEKEDTNIYPALSSSISKEIEIYYNFRLNKKIQNFEFEDYTDDIRLLNGNMCLSSGKANIALSTTEIPKCVEFVNLHINKFYFNTKGNSNIFLKFQIFKIRSNTVHIYPVSKQVLTSKHILWYFNNDNKMIIDRNLLVYKDFTYKNYGKGNKFLRICNIIGFGREFYENKFWLEITWDPDIQNLICFEKFGYIN